MERFKLIELVRQRPILWDHRHSDYHNRDKKMLMWFEISDELKITSEDAKKRWECLRDAYRREFRKRSGLKGERNSITYSRWPYFNALNFLKDVISLKTPQIEIDPFADSSSTAKTKRTPSKNIPKKKPTNSNKINSSKQRDIKTKKKMANVLEKLLDSEKKQNEYENDEDHQFILSILPQFKKISSEKRFKTRIEIMKLISTQEASKRWECLRNIFEKESIRLDRLRSDTEEQTHSQWPYYNNMLFLKTIVNEESSELFETNFEPFVEILDTRSGEYEMKLPTTHSTENTSELIKNESIQSNFKKPSEISGKQQSTNSTGTATNPNVLKEKHKKIEKKMIKTLEKLLDFDKQQNQYANDDDYQFFLSIIPTLKKLPENIKIETRTEIMKLIENVLDEDDV